MKFLLFRKLAILLCCSLLAAGWSCLSVAYSELDVLVVDDTISEMALNPFVEYMEDNRGLYSKERAIKEKPRLFEVNQKRIIEFGISDDTYWMRANVRYQPREKEGRRDWYLVIRSSHQAKHEVWTYSGRKVDGRPVVTPIVQEPWRDDTYKIPLEPNRDVTVLVKQSLFGSNQTQMFITSEFAVASVEPKVEFSFGIFYGLLFSMMFFFFLLFLFVREPILFFYSTYTLCITVSMMTITGHGQWLFWSDDAIVSAYVTNCSALGSMLSLIAVTRLFITIKNYSILWDNILMANCFLMAFLTTLSLLSVNKLFVLFVATISVVSLVLVFLTTFIALQQGSREARHYLLTFIPLSAVGLLWVSTVIGGLDIHLVSDQWVIMGVSLQVLLLAFGLGKQVIEKMGTNILQIKNEESEPEQSLPRNQISDLLLEKTSIHDESDERYWELYQDSPDPIFVCDFDGTFVTANKAFIKLIACENEDRLMTFGSLYTLVSFNSASQEETFYSRLNKYYPIKNFPLGFTSLSGELVRTKATVSVMADRSLGRKVILGEVEAA